MRFRVRWSHKMLEEVTRNWLQADADLRQAITVACHSIDQRLRSNPHDEGESRPGNRRITFVEPFAVFFRIEPEAQTVSVLQILLFRHRGHN